MLLVRIAHGGLCSPDSLFFEVGTRGTVTMPLWSTSVDGHHWSERGQAHPVSRLSMRPVSQPAPSGAGGT
jgi:hypothetical protein